MHNLKEGEKNLKGAEEDGDEAYKFQKNYN